MTAKSLRQQYIQTLLKGRNSEQERAFYESLDINELERLMNEDTDGDNVQGEINTGSIFDNEDFDYSQIV